MKKKFYTLLCLGMLAPHGCWAEEAGMPATDASSSPGAAAITSDTTIPTESTEETPDLGLGGILGIGAGALAMAGLGAVAQHVRTKPLGSSKSLAADEPTTPSKINVKADRAAAPVAVISETAIPVKERAEVVSAIPQAPVGLPPKMSPDGPVSENAEKEKKIDASEATSSQPKTSIPEQAPDGRPATKEPVEERRLVSAFETQQKSLRNQLKTTRSALKKTPPYEQVTSVAQALETDGATTDIETLAHLTKPLETITTGDHAASMKDLAEERDALEKAGEKLRAELEELNQKTNTAPDKEKAALKETLLAKTHDLEAHAKEYESLIHRQVAAAITIHQEREVLLAKEKALVEQQNLLTEAQEKERELQDAIAATRTKLTTAALGSDEEKNLRRQLTFQQEALAKHSAEATQALEAAQKRPLPNVLSAATRQTLARANIPAPASAEITDAKPTLFDVMRSSEGVVQTNATHERSEIEAVAKQANAAAEQLATTRKALREARTAKNDAEITRLEAELATLSDEQKARRKQQEAAVAQAKETQDRERFTAMSPEQQTAELEQKEKAVKDAAFVEKKRTRSLAGYKKSGRNDATMPTEPATQGSAKRLSAAKKKTLTTKASLKRERTRKEAAANVDNRPIDEILDDTPEKNTSGQTTGETLETVRALPTNSDNTDKEPEVEVKKTSVPSKSIPPENSEPSRPTTPQLTDADPQRAEETTNVTATEAPPTEEPRSVKAAQDGDTTADSRPLEQQKPLVQEPTQAEEDAQKMQTKKLSRSQLKPSQTKVTNGSAGLRKPQENPLLKGAAAETPRAATPPLQGDVSASVEEPAKPIAPEDSPRGENQRQTATAADEPAQAIGAMGKSPTPATSGETDAALAEEVTYAPPSGKTRLVPRTPLGKPKSTSADPGWTDEEKAKIKQYYQQETSNPLLALGRVTVSKNPIKIETTNESANIEATTDTEPQTPPDSEPALIQKKKSSATGKKVLQRQIENPESKKTAGLQPVEAHREPKETPEPKTQLPSAKKVAQQRLELANALSSTQTALDKLPKDSREREELNLQRKQQKKMLNNHDAQNQQRYRPAMRPTH